MRHLGITQKRLIHGSDGDLEASPFTDMDCDRSAKLGQASAFVCLAIVCLLCSVCFVFAEWVRAFCVCVVRMPSVSMSVCVCPASLGTVQSVRCIESITRRTYCPNS